MTAQREWFPASELAGLPSMPSSKRGVQMQAEAQAWRSREATGRGGTRTEFHITALPAATRAALVWHRPNVLAGGNAVGADVVRAQAVATSEALGMNAGQRAELTQQLARRAIEMAQAQGLRSAAAMNSQQQRRMDARLAVLADVDQFRAATGMGATLAEQNYALAWTQGGGHVPAWVRTELGTLSAGTLQRWRLQVKAGGISRLAGDYGNRKGATKVAADEGLLGFVEAFLVQFPHARATQVHRGIKARLGAQIASGEIDAPSVRSLERWIEQWRQANKQTLAALENPDHYKNKYMVAFGSQSEGVERINQLWEMDSTPGDVMLKDGRHAVLGVIDVYTRRLRLLVSRTSKATAVCGLLRSTLLDWGVPEVIKTDNGSDYVSNHTTRVIQGLAVHQELCPPFQPWHKPHIERSFGTFSRQLLELLPGYIGHNVADRNAIEARKSFADRLMTRGETLDVNMTADDFQAFCNNWVDHIYHHDNHAGLGDRTPFSVAAASRDQVRVIEDERVLDVLLAEAPENNGRRTVQKKGIRFDGADFIAPELEAYVGESVLVRFDALDHDLGRLYVYSDSGFICIAECPERTGMDRRAVAIAAKRLQTQRVQAERAALKKAAKKVGTDTIVEEILASRAEQAGKLARLPAPQVRHTSEGLDMAASALAAASAQRGSSADLLSIDGVSSTWAKLQAEQQANAAQVPTGLANELAQRRAVRAVVTPTFDTVHARARWLLEQARTRALTGEERQTLAGYKAQHPASYRSLDDQITELFGAMHQENDPGQANGAGSV
jgi:hypothetical protein